MSRHRDIRNMDYSEDYDGYDDVYGHSVDDDIYISPSHRQFMYNRENSGQSKSDFSMEEGIQEEDESIEEESQLSEEDKVKLESCLDHVKSIFAPMRMPRPDLVKIIVGQKFDCEKIVNYLLKSQCSPPTERRDKDETFSLFSSCNQPFHKNSINPNKQPSFSKKVEPQSEINMKFPRKLEICDASRNGGSTSNTSLLPITHLLLADYSQRTPNITNVLNVSKKTNINMTEKTNSDIANTFLSKMKNEKNSDEHNSEKKRVAPVASAFLSKLNFKGTDSKEEDPKISFLSKIPTSENDMQDSASNDFLRKLTANHHDNTRFLNNSMQNSPGFNQNYEDSNAGSPPIKFSVISEGEKGSLTLNISENFTSKTPLKSNGLKQAVNDKLNVFLSRIDTNRSPKVLGQTNSDISLTNKKSPSLSTEFSKLKVSDIKSMPLLKGKEDDNFNINLTTALQRSSLRNSKMKSLSNHEKSENVSNEKFDIPFVDENEMEEDTEILECSMDLSHLATKRISYYRKKPSPLGRMMCLRYKITKVRTYKKNRVKLDPRLIKFNFLEPSPDDQIKKHIKQNL